MTFEKFKFRNFEPTEEIRNLANRTLTQLLDLLPSEAHFGATLAKVENAFEGFIEIVSTAGTIREKSTDADPASLIDRLSEKIREKIATWHQRRLGDFQNLALPFTKKA